MAGLWVTKEIAAGYLLTLHLAPDSRGVVIDKLELAPGDATKLVGIAGGFRVPTGVRAGRTVWARVSLARERRSVLTAMLDVLNDPDLEPPGRVGIRTIAMLMGFSPDNVKPPRRPGRPRKDDTTVEYELAVLAAAYAQACRSHKLPQEEVKRLLQPISPELVPPRANLRPRFAQARRRGLLTPTPRGRAGGEVTPTARRILAEHDFHAAWWDGESR